MRLWTFGFNKMLECSWVAAQLEAPRVVLSSVELVSYPKPPVIVMFVRWAQIKSTSKLEEFSSALTYVTLLII
jgi:hypothetical protein